jgi:hypothetical protein
MDVHDCNDTCADPAAAARALLDCDDDSWRGMTDEDRLRLAHGAAQDPWTAGEALLTLPRERRCAADGRIGATLAAAAARDPAAAARALLDCDDDSWRGMTDDVRLPFIQAIARDGHLASHVIQAMTDREWEMLTSHEQRILIDAMIAAFPSSQEEVRFCSSIAMMAVIEIMIIHAIAASSVEQFVDLAHRLRYAAMPMAVACAVIRRWFVDDDSDPTLDALASMAQSVLRLALPFHGGIKGVHPPVAPCQNDGEE